MKLQRYIITGSSIRSMVAVVSMFLPCCVVAAAAAASAFVTQPPIPPFFPSLGWTRASSTTGTRSTTTVQLSPFSLSMVMQPWEESAENRPLTASRRAATTAAVTTTTTTTRTTGNRSPAMPAAMPAAKPVDSSSTTTTTTSTGIIRTYEHDGWTLSYRYRPASPGHENDDPLLLIHPVGIGLNSWFWEQFFDAWVGGPLYAPDLIGCGMSNGGDAWNPDERGLFFPLSWTQGCETLLQTVIRSSSSSQGFALPFRKRKQQCIVVAQGGLAPVGVLLASRNPDTVSKLVLTSPPTWDAMTAPIPETELARNYNFLRSSFPGKLAFSVLESRWAIAYFSDLFLFQSKSDPTWLDRARSECSVASRPPVMAFNAGFCNHRSYETELRELVQQPTLVLQGTPMINVP